MSGPLRVLTVDPSMTNTGFCLPDGTTTALGTKPDADATGMADHIHRLHREQLLRERMTDLADTHGIDLVVIEGYAPNQHTNAIYSGELGALLRDRADSSDYAWVVVPPNLRGKYATGKGNASKDLVLQEVSARTGRVFASSDECDAWVLWAMAQDAYQLPNAWGMPQSHRDALTGVDWPTVGARRALWAPHCTYKPPKKKVKKRG